MKKLYALLAFLCTYAGAFAQYDAVVAKDGTGNFTTVQAAIAAAPTGRTTPYKIYIKKGTYREKDTIPSNKPFIQLIGESVATTIISWDDYSGKSIPNGGGTYGTSNSATVTVNATDFSAQNITFENTTGDAPQALAINVNADRCSFKNCRFLGGQDTVLTNGDGKKNYFKNCYIDGVVDFIFGGNRAVFDSCIIYPKTRQDNLSGSYITAANTSAAEPYGYVFRDCFIPANQGVTSYVLGRPWQNDGSTTNKANNKVVLLNTTMGGGIVKPEGWSTWDAGTNTALITYAEYKSKRTNGVLVDVSQRVAWSKQLTDAEAANYNNANLFGSWDPCSFFSDGCNGTGAQIAVSNFKLKKGAGTTGITWNISWPIAAVKYELFRSSDRVAFSKIHEQTSPNDTAINYNYSENIPPPGQTYYYYIAASKAGLATHITDTLSVSSTPTITVSGAFGSFVQGVGLPSTAQTYIVSGASLTNNIVITAPANYELSSNSGSTWFNSSNPIVLTPVNGTVATTTIYVRLNAAAAGTYNGDIQHTSTGAASVTLPVSGTTQAAPLAVSNTLITYPFTTNNADSAALRSPGMVATLPTLNNLYVSQGFNVNNVPAYSATYGQALSAVLGTSTANDGSWGTAAGGPGGNLTRIHYEQFVFKASSTHSVRLDSLLIKAAFFLSANGRLAAVYSKTGFTTGDSTNVPGAPFGTPLALPAQHIGGFGDIRLAFNGGTGITLASGDSLTVRIYLAVGSATVPRFGLLKDVGVKGLAFVNPNIGDYRSRQTGIWDDVNNWERWNGTAWVSPAPEVPVYNNSNITTIQSGHTITFANTLTTGFGYVHLVRVNAGAQLIVNAGANFNIANDGAPSTATTDLQVDGSMSIFGGLFTNGNVSVKVNGSLIHSGTGMNLSNGGDTVNIGAGATWQHNVNSGTTPNNMVFHPTATFLVSGITTNQTGIFKNAVKYGNIIWNCPGETNYYAFRGTLDSANVKGSFTVVSTGSSNITFFNGSGRLVLPGGYYQTGGTVNFRESGNITDTLSVGGDFSVTGGTFNSNAGTGSSLLVNLTGTNKTMVFAQTSATNTSWNISGVYTLGTGLAIPSATFGATVAGTLHTGTNAVSGAGNFIVQPAAILSSGAANGLNGNVTVSGTKTLSKLANYVFNGTVAQSTGTLLPDSVNTLTINNMANVSLSGTAVVTGGPLYLTAGKLLLGANNITSASITGASSASYIVTDGAGKLRLLNVGAGATRFPVGSSVTAYNPAVLTNAGTADNFSVNVKNTFDAPFPSPDKVVNKQWNITPDNLAGSPNVTVALGWQTADQASGFNSANATAVMHYMASAWSGNTATITGSGTIADPYMASAAGFTAFSPFAVANTSALPVTLLSFNAVLNGNAGSITWSTSAEKNVQHFMLERSADGQQFAAIATIAASNTSRINNYNFTDMNLLTGLNYYRLKVVDKDGSVSYSRIAVINTRLKGMLVVYPNPVKDQLQVTFPAIAGKASLEIVSAAGKIIAQYTLLNNNIQNSFNVSALAKGVYWLVFKQNDQQLRTQFVKY